MVEWYFEISFTYHVDIYRGGCIIIIITGSTVEREGDNYITRGVTIQPPRARARGLIYNIITTYTQRPSVNNLLKICFSYKVYTHTRAYKHTRVRTHTYNINTRVLLLIVKKKRLQITRTRRWRFRFTVYETARCFNFVIPQARPSPRVRLRKINRLLADKTTRTSWIAEVRPSYNVTSRLSSPSYNNQTTIIKR